MSKAFLKVKRSNILCSPLIHRSFCIILENKMVSEPSFTLEELTYKKQNVSLIFLFFCSKQVLYWEIVSATERTSGMFSRLFLLPPLKNILFD